MTAFCARHFVSFADLDACDLNWSTCRTNPHASMIETMIGHRYLHARGRNIKPNSEGNWNAASSIATQYRRTGTDD
jgi:hypothetical protein